MEPAIRSWWSPHEAQTISAPELARAATGWRELAVPALYRRLATSVTVAIREGRLPLGARLPSERVLAETLNVNRKTIVAAYELLAHEGIVESRRSAGYFVRRPRSIPPAVFPVGASGDASALDLSFAAPMDAPPQLADALAALDPEELLHWHGYAPLGLEALRRAVARRYTERGAPTEPDQILITNGGQYAIQLAIQAYVGFGDRALVESPTYPLILDALRARRAIVMSTRIDPRAGWDLGETRKLLREERPALMAVIPDCHMPTGRTLQADERAELVSVVRSVGTTLLVDETTADLGEGGPLRPICAHSSTGVITVGSVSKTAWGGLRVGWVRAEPEVIQRLAQLRATLDVAGPPIDQMIAEMLLRQWDAIAAQRRARAAEGRTIAEAALGSALSAWEWEKPDGGLCLWVRLPRPMSIALTHAAPAHGLLLMPGDRFAADRDLDQWLRVPYVLPEDSLRTAIARLAECERSVTGAAVSRRRA